MKASPKPISADAFAAALLPLLPPETHALALAVSGGRDSMALLHLCAAFAQTRNIRLLSLTVDHGLRPEGAVEAASVGASASALGVAHRSLRWNDPGGGNLEGRAREARYRLLAEACAEADIAHLLVAHTLEDQAETVLLRLARGSGIDGLAGMAPVTRRLGLSILRPLLGISRTRLTATLETRGSGWIDDPMNDDPRFARVALRKAEAVLAAAGLTPSRLAMTARHMTRARLALEDSCAQFEAKAVCVNAAGFAQLDVPALIGAPEEIGLRVLSRLIMRVGGLAYPPRFAGLESVYQAVRGGALGRGRTLGGCRILPARGERLFILREPAALAPLQAIAAGCVQLWDGRFKVRLAGPPQGGKAAVGALGLGGVQFLRKTAPGTLPRIMAPARTSLPALWLGPQLAAVPHLGYADPAAPGFEAAFTGV